LGLHKLRAATSSGAHVLDCAAARSRAERKRETACKRSGGQESFLQALTLLGRAPVAL
jgi:hypothetical protein